MNTKEINSFLDEMFDSNVKFAKVHGASSLLNPEMMLVADVLSENVELLAEVIKERFEENNLYRAEAQKRVSTFV